MKTVFIFLKTLIITSFMVYMTGCTIIGLTLGNAADRSSITRFDASSSSVYQIKPNTELTIYLKSGQETSGQFVGYERFATSDYAIRYQNFKDSDADNRNFPSFTDSIGINRPDKFDYIFLGFDYGCISIKSVKDSIIRNVNLNDIQYINTCREVMIHSEDIKKLMIEGTIPFLSKLTFIVENEKGRHEIDGEIIKRIDIGEIKHTGRTIGLVLGLTIDVIILYGISTFEMFSGEAWSK